MRVAADSVKTSGRVFDQTRALMPVGTILAYAGATLPQSWLKCDGAAIPQDKSFDDLRKALGENNTPNLSGQTLIGEGANPKTGTVFARGQSVGKKSTR